jgi:hypothetical protein
MSDFDFLLKPSTLFFLGLIIIPTILLEAHYRHKEIVEGKKGILGAASTGLLVGIISTLAVFGLLSASF